MAPTFTQDLLYLDPDNFHDSKTQSPRDDLAINGPIEGFSEAESVELLRWARHYAPDLLTRLLTAYGHRTRPPVTPAKASTPSPPKSRSGAPFSRCGVATGTPVDSSRAAPTLKDLEREQIKRVLAESATLREAASKLGIDETTLWRKRKRYRIQNQSNR